MLTVLVILLLLAAGVWLFTASQNTGAIRASQERLERHAISKLPPPDGFEDCGADVLAAVREGSHLGAIIAYRKQHGPDMEKAKARVDALTAALRAGPPFGRPPTGIFG